MLGWNTRWAGRAAPCLLMAGALQAGAAEQGWWQALGDPALDQLMATSEGAELPALYVELRACQALQRLHTEVQAAPWQTVALGAPSSGTKAGLSAPAAGCEPQWALLSAASGRTVPQLRDELGAGAGRLPQLPAVLVHEVPAQLLAQRADLQHVAQEVLAADSAWRQLMAQATPRLLLQGRIAVAWVPNGPGGTRGLWSGSEVAASLSEPADELPEDAVDAAYARCEDAHAAYQARLQVAVQEVQQALTELHQSAAAAGQAQAAAQVVMASYADTQARRRWQLASGAEVEMARLADLQARAALVALQRDQLQAWIALHAVLGGSAPLPITPTTTDPALLASVGRG